MVKDYGHLLAQDPAYADKAARIAALARDPVELVARGMDRRCAASSIAERRSESSRSIRRARCSTACRFAARSRSCCATPATRSCRSPTRTCAAARRERIRSCSRSSPAQLKANKLRALEAHRPEIIATANIGCMTHLQSGTRIRFATGSSCSTAQRPVRRARPRRMIGAPRNWPRRDDGAARTRVSQRVSVVPRDPDAMDGQRRVRSRQQRHVLLVFRHRRERAPDSRGRPRHSRRANRIGVVVETACRFHKPLSFPETIDAGMRVAHARHARRSPTRSRCFDRATTTPRRRAGSCTSGSIANAGGRSPYPITIRAALAALRLAGHGNAVMSGQVEIRRSGVRADDGGDACRRRARLLGLVPRRGPALSRLCDHVRRRRRRKRSIARWSCSSRGRNSASSGSPATADAAVGACVVCYAISTSRGGLVAKLDDVTIDPRLAAGRASVRRCSWRSLRTCASVRHWAHRHRVPSRQRRARGVSTSGKAFGRSTRNGSRSCCRACCAAQGIGRLRRHLRSRTHYPTMARATRRGHRRASVA